MQIQKPVWAKCAQSFTGFRLSLSSFKRINRVNQSRTKARGPARHAEATATGVNYSAVFVTN